MLLSWCIGMSKRSSRKSLKGSSSRSKVREALSLEKAQRLTQHEPGNPVGWKALGKHLAIQQRWEEAGQSFEKAIELSSHDTELLELLATSKSKKGLDGEAITLLQSALKQNPNSPNAHYSLSKLLLQRSQHHESLEHIEYALRMQPKNLDMLSQRGVVLYRLHRYFEAIEVFDDLLEQQPEHYSHWNNAANLRRDLGLFDEADNYYRQSIDRTNHDAKPYSNRLTALHYNPNVDRDTIYKVSREWEKKFGPTQVLTRPLPFNLALNKQLRIGMISDGFRNHPVGRMITSALEQIAPRDLALYAYSTNNAVDPLTVRIRKISTQWMAVSHLSDEALAQQVRDDQIDILIDLAGHNTGSRMRVMAMQPAPLLVKWVGGLINTTGLSAIDYLLTDSIESPDGEDPYYTEKLIRLPDDYICYDPSDEHAELRTLPALRNGHITLGCFNNPSKVNEVVLAEWAKIMHQLPGSQLFLKGFQYSSEALCQRVRGILASHDIPATRLIIEGPSSHKELMETYNRVDIALDPWPYSGGLTTCEAFFMGVPVVTLPGPTFAGRHSATHLVNAGMPELVVSSWDEYRERVIELASDLDSLSTIRSHLRDVLLQSPVCDAPRFAKHFTTAMRAIWQRYSEGKMPAALALDKDGQAQFEDEDQTVEILHAEPLAEEQDEFRWQLEGKIIVIDNSGKLVSQGNIHRLRQLNAFGVVAFDPTSRVQNPAQFEGSEDIQVLPHVTLGNGEPGKLYACLDPTFSSTLEPMPLEQQHGANPQGAKVLTELPINTIALDSIEGLDSLDWLILDELSDADNILQHGKRALQDTLLIEARLAFQPTHERQPNLSELSHWASRNGFRFYRLERLGHRSHLPDRANLKKKQSSELINADAVFLPSHERMDTLTNNQRIKLAFLLHTIYGIRDMSYELLAEVDEQKAEEYLIAEGVVETKPEVVPDTPVSETPESKEQQEFPLPDAPFMSPAERNLFKKSLKKAQHYFEFGSGGSTVWAVKEGLLVKGVESDAKWVNALKDRLGEKCQVEAVDIGPTKEWGFPVSMQQASKFPAYSKAIHQHQQAFDLILVDGRFRVACAMAAIQHILEHSEEPQEARIFIHDFWNRPQYHAVLEFLDVVEKAETAGLFKVKSGLDKTAISGIWDKYSLQPN